MLAEELVVIDADSALWDTVRPLLDAALRLEQNGPDYSWHGWNKQQVDAFLKRLPSTCSLIAGVWETASPEESNIVGDEKLVLGVVCEVVEGEIRSVRTFEALSEAGLKPARELEPGLDDALEIMRAAGDSIAPVAWALFTDRATWNEWIFDVPAGSGSINKGAMLAAFARQGRCVLLGTQAAHQHCR